MLGARDKMGFSLNLRKNNVASWPETSFWLYHSCKNVISICTGLCCVPISKRSTDLASPDKHLDIVRLLMMNMPINLHYCYCVGFCFFQLKMVLIKCCDISNEVRPTEVAEPWVDCLLEEYFMQVTSASAVTLCQNQAAVGCPTLVGTYCITFKKKKISMYALDRATGRSPRVSPWLLSWTETKSRNPPLRSASSSLSSSQCLRLSWR